MPGRENDVVRFMGDDQICGNCALTNLFTNRKRGYCYRYRKRVGFFDKACNDFCGYLPEAPSK